MSIAKRAHMHWFRDDDGNDDDNNNDTAVWIKYQWAPKEFVCQYELCKTSTHLFRISRSDVKLRGSPIETHPGAWECYCKLNIQCDTLPMNYDHVSIFYNRVIFDGAQ